MGVRARALNEQGSEEFRSFVARAKSGHLENAPWDILFDDRTSVAVEPELIMVEGPFASRLEFGKRLADCLEVAGRRTISLDAGLWNWLALFYFDDLCPAKDGIRKPKDLDHYVLERRFIYHSYYKHLVRFAWLSVVLHGDDAKVLLSQPDVSAWGELSEQLGAYQGVFGSRTAIAVARRLYVDRNGIIPGGAAGKGRGSVRRFAAVLKQFTLTYDLRTASVDGVLGLLPDEFDRFKREQSRGRRVRADPAIVMQPAHASSADSERGIDSRT
jgi:hypothetical protein